jgi:hypothetical protein
MPVYAVRGDVYYLLTTRSSSVDMLVPVLETGLSLPVLIPHSL